MSTINLSNLNFRLVDLSNDLELRTIASVDVKIPAKYDSDFSDYSHQIEDRIERFKKLSSNDLFMLIEEKRVNDKENQTNIVGFILVYKYKYFSFEAASIDTLWIKKEFRELGLAKKLKLLTEKWVIDHNLHHIRTWVHVDNKKMQNLNSKLNYKIVHTKMVKSLKECKQTLLNTNVDQKFPQFQTDRLLIRAFTLNDAESVFKIVSNYNVSKMTTIPFPYTQNMAKEWISKHQNNFLNKISIEFALELKETNEIIGCVGFFFNSSDKVEIGYWISETYWGNGYCTEACKYLIKFIFENYKINKMTSRYRSDNPNSGKVMQKIGMKQEGVLEQEYLRDEVYHDMIVYGLTRDKYLKLNF